MIRVILDTNFLMIPGQYKVDVFEEIRKLLNTPYQLCIFSATIEELQKISKENSKDKSNAKLALMLIKQKNLKTLKNSSEEKGYIDKIMSDNVNEKDIICTQDKVLKKQLKTKFPKIHVITLNRRIILR